MGLKDGKLTERDKQIFDIMTMVAGDFELPEVLDKLAEVAVKITDTYACSIRLLDKKGKELSMRSTYGLSEEYRSKGPVSRQDTVIKAAFEGEAVVLDDMRIDGRVKYPEAAAKEGLVSQLTVAMKFKNDPIGVLRLYSPEPNRFDEDRRAIARLVAAQCAVAISNARFYAEALEGAHMAEQMRLAGLVQRRMIPERSPRVSGLDISAVYQPCFQIGGDLYDFIELDENTIAISIADVIGKGIPAAIMMSMFRGMLRAYADSGHNRHTLKEIIKKLNTTSCSECRNGEFITLFLANIDTKSLQMTYCNCGHEPALLIRDSEMIELNEGGLVLGVMEDAEYAIGKTSLQDGDTLLMYTDGLIDAVNFEGDLWGKDRMYNAVKKCLGRTSKNMIRKLLGDRRRFVGLAQQTDDTSIVAIKVDRKRQGPIK